MGAQPEGVTSARLQDAPAERFNRLRDPLGVVSFGINQMVLAPGQRGRIHRHKRQEEVYLVLSGTLTLMVEGEALEFSTGEVVRVAPSTRRQLVNRHRSPLSLLALGGHADHSHEPRDGELFAGWQDSEPGTPDTVPAPADLPESELR
jgi:mannose-6-phosphate isomerase-like protein (cupin superfamily)